MSMPFLGRCMALGAQSFFLFGVATAAPETDLCPPAVKVPEAPFTLSIALDRTKASVGETISCKYTLTNITNHAICACANAWDEYYMFGPNGQRSATTVVCDGILGDDIFKIPPGASLTWQRDIEVLDVGPGPSNVQGIFKSKCWLWNGSVSSDSVRIEILSKKR